MRDDEDRATQGRDEGDAAAEAFEAVRGEVALLRRAVERLAAERAEVPEPPDYTETLGELQRGVNTAAENIARIGQFLKQAPALAMTPEQMAQRITAAGSAARREDQAALTTARQSLEDAARQLRAYVVSGRTGDEQSRLLAWTAIGGAIAGIVLWSLFQGPILRATPDSWLRPERAAARVLGGSTWDGARRLAGASRPDTWNAMVAGAIIGQGNEAAVERCKRAAAKAGKGVRCTVTIEPEEER